MNVKKVCKTFSHFLLITVEGLAIRERDKIKLITYL